VRKPKPPQPRRSAQLLDGSMRTLVCLLLLLGIVQAQADMPRITERDALISWGLERFWGNGRDSTGAYIQPSSDLDRRTVPVRSSVAYRVIEAGEISGLAEWCGLDWKSHYFSLTAAARQRGMSDKQVAFIGVLHGVVQGNTLSSKVSPCAKNDGILVAEKLKASRKQGLEGPNTSLEPTRGR